MPEHSPETQTILDAFHRELAPDYGAGGLTAALRAFVNAFVPQETAAPRAMFDCEPNLKSRDGTLRHDHSAYLRRHFAQEELNIRWEQRQQTRRMMLASIIEMEQIR